MTAAPEAAAAAGANGAGETPAPALPDDTGDLRGHHFKLLLTSAGTWALILLPSLILGVILLAIVGPLIGLAGFVGGILAGVLVAYSVAGNRAADDFFSTYASQRGLELGGRATLPRQTPLLRKGDDRYAERTFSGDLGEGIDGTLALFTYEVEHTDQDGNDSTSYYRYTIGLTAIPECSDRVPELYCQRKFGLRALEKFEDVFRRSKERVKLESQALDERYEIFARKGQDAIWLRRLFSPSFIVWLAEEAPPKFAFELVDGHLCCYVNGHRKNAAELDAVRTATVAVARRLRDEANE